MDKHIQHREKIDPLSPFDSYFTGMGTHNATPSLIVHVKIFGFTCFTPSVSASIISLLMSELRYCWW